MHLQLSSVPPSDIGHGYGPVAMEDPRIARTRAAVMEAATDLLIEGGPAALTVDAVVARSGVAKSTLYRHWRARDELLADVFRSCAPQLDPPPSELGFLDALRQLIRMVHDRLNDPHWARLVPAMMMLKLYEPSIAAVSDDVEDTQLVIVRDVLGRGVAEGVLRPDVDATDAMLHLIGPSLFAHLTGVRPLDDDFADRSAEAYVAANRAPE